MYKCFYAHLEYLYHHLDYLCHLKTLKFVRYCPSKWQMFSSVNIQFLILSSEDFKFTGMSCSHVAGPLCMDSQLYLCLFSLNLLQLVLGGKPGSCQDVYGKELNTVLLLAWIMCHTKVSTHSYLFRCFSTPSSTILFNSFSTESGIAYSSPIAT